MTSLPGLIRTYGYWALFVGTMLEGETVLILAGFAASQGHLQLPWVVLVAMIGAFAGDQAYFFLGRWKGKEFLESRPAWKPRVGRVRRLLERHYAWVLLGFRFLYGVRTVTPLVLGTTDIRTSRVVVLDAIASSLWAFIVGTGGYLFGKALELVFEDIRRYEHLAMGAIAVAGLLLWIVLAVRRRR